MIDFPWEKRREFLHGDHIGGSHNSKRLRVVQLYQIEAELLGRDPQTRLAGRQQRSAPLIADMHTWLIQHRARVAAKSLFGEALAYVAKYWDGLCLFLADGRVEIDSNAVERTIRPIALNRKNALFASHDAGAENWATIASLVETCKLNAIDPLAYGQHTYRYGQRPQTEPIDKLLPWNYAAEF